MRGFERYLEERKVKRVSSDRELAESLLKNIHQREKSALKLNLSEFSLIVFENIYDCLRELIDVILALDGFKSYSHEANVAYLNKFDFSQEKLINLDRFRIKRNNSKYYGKPPSLEDAREIKKYYLENKVILLKIIDQKRKQKSQSQ